MTFSLAASEARLPATLAVQIKKIHRLQLMHLRVSQANRKKNGKLRLFQRIVLMHGLFVWKLE
jgi:hypothetical protein